MICLVKNLQQYKKFENVYNKNYLLTEKFYEKESMSTQDPVVYIEINLGKILLAKLKHKMSYCYHIMVVHIKHVIFPKYMMYFLDFQIYLMQIVDLR